MPYLAALGVSHVFSSPVFEAVEGSRHGYDIVDPCRVRAAIGGEAGRCRLIGALRARDMGLVADVVPNHQATQGNARWLDVLALGSGSQFAHHFDLGIGEEAGGTDGPLVLPVLAEPYGVELDAGTITLVVERGQPLVAYGGQRFPLSPQSVDALLEDGGAAPAAVRCARLHAAAARVNNDRAALHDLLERQHYRLAWWRLARDESPYRRFFDVSTLIGIRVDRPDVFAATHALVLQWARDGSVDGLRIDHVDGLADPGAYLTRLRERAPGQWLTVEKILAAEEALPDWPVDGTTGYEFGALVARVMTEPGSEAAIADFYEAFTGQAGGFAAAARQARLEVMAQWLPGDTLRVARILYGLCQQDLRLRDYSLRDMTALVREMVAELPVYRTYVTARGMDRRDAAVLAGVFDRVRQRRPDLPAPLVNFAAGLFADGADEAGREFVIRLQQLSTTVAAKAIEDTAFYRSVAYLPHNDVGGDPSRFADSVETFHHAVLAWQGRCPRGMRSTMTHDSKRGEDVRARLTVLSERWPAWMERVARWTARAEAHRGGGLPDRNFEYYLYQTLAGAWPLSRERAQAHSVKAAREAKMFTNWLVPSAEYEAAVRRLVDGLYDDEAFIADLAAFVEELHPADWTKSLAQLALKLTVPGVPDVYQGSELWQLSLVDPDNRGPVDYGRLRSLLGECASLTAPDVLARMDEGLPKLWTTARALALRARDPGLARPESEYRPLEVTGERARHVIAFLRGASVAVAVPVRGVPAPWGDTCIDLPRGTWTHVLAGRQVAGGACAVQELFDLFPVALLERASA